MSRLFLVVGCSVMTLSACAAEPDDALVGGGAVTAHAAAVSSGRAAQVLVGTPSVDAGPAISPVGGFQAAGPPVSFVHVETDTNYQELVNQGTVLLARTAASTDLSPDGWWLRLDVIVRNDSAQPQTLTGFGLGTDVGGFQVAALEDPVVVGPGQTGLAKPQTLTGVGPAPSQVTIRAYFAGYQGPAERTYSLQVHPNPTSAGGYRFPARGSELGAGSFWTPGPMHKHSRSQRYAYDLKVVRWRNGQWVYLTEQAYTDDALGIAAAGSQNEHHLVWGLPVYAMADGIIRKCRRSRPDNTPGVKQSGANSLLIQHGNGEYAAYAHMKKDSIPAALCPAEAPVDDDDPVPAHVPVAVKAGQFLGQVGNSGPSTGPHLHLHVQDSGPDVPKSRVRGLPLNFWDIVVRTYEGFDPQVDPHLWNFVGAGQAAAVDARHLVFPNPCGWPEREPALAAPGVRGSTAPPRCEPMYGPLPAR